MSSEPTSEHAGVRVFISYGRKDASELATRLATQLTKNGFDVWLDRSELRAGKAWEQQIIDGLRETKVVIALLSPHSTRRDVLDQATASALMSWPWRVTNTPRHQSSPF
jgi:hypothetical protein